MKKPDLLRRNSGDAISPSAQSPKENQDEPEAASGACMILLESLDPNGLQPICLAPFIKPIAKESNTSAQPGNTETPSQYSGKARSVRFMASGHADRSVVQPFCLSLSLNSIQRGYSWSHINSRRCLCTYGCCAFGWS